MSMCGKVFGVLVLLLSIAVAALSFMLSNQRKLFREHSEALASGIVKIAGEIRGEDGVDVSSSLGQVSYTKAPEGGKESGSLGFEDFRKNQQSVSGAVNAIVSALQARYEQTQNITDAYAQLGAFLGVDKAAGVNKESILTDAEYQKKIDAVKIRAKVLAGRDEIIRTRLDNLTAKVGVSNAELDKSRYVQCARNQNVYTIEDTFNEIDNALALIVNVQAKQVDAINKFKNTITRYDNWNFDANALKAAAAKFSDVSKASDNDGDKERKRFLSNVEDRLASFVKDGEGLNKYLNDAIREKDNAQAQSEQHKQTADRVETEKNELNQKFVDLQSKHRSLEKDNEAMTKRMQDLLPTTPAIKVKDPLEGDIITDIGGISDEDFSCNILQVDADLNFVILSANNRMLCPDAQLIVVGDSKNKEIVRMKVKECTDIVSKAYIIRGDARSIKVGDRVELSGDHKLLVKELENEREKQADEERNNKRIEEMRKAHEDLERRREAEKKNVNAE